MKIFSVVFSIAILFIPYVAFTQGFFINAKTGYSFQIATDDLGSPLDEVGDGDLLITVDGSISDKSLYGTLGESFTATIGMGYNIDENFIVGMDITFSKGKKFLDGRIQTPEYFAEQRSQTIGLALAPQIIIQSSTKVKPYARFGLAIPVAGRITTFAKLVDDEERVLCRLLTCPGGVSPFTNADLHITLDGKAKTTARATVGFLSAAGVRYPLNDRVSFFGELSLGVITLKPKSTTYIEYQDSAEGFLSPGIALPLTSRSLEELTTYERVIHYVDEITENSNNSSVNPNYNPDAPMEMRAVKANGNSLALLFGAQYNF